MTSKTPDLTTEVVEIDALTFDPQNARKHDSRNLGAIAESLSQFGQRRPLVVTHAGVVIAGNGTLEAARSLGWKRISVTRTPKSWTDDKAKAYALADNRTAELAAWDDTLLAGQLVELDAAGWDTVALGFEPAGGTTTTVEPEGDGADRPGSLLNQVPEKTVSGDVWLLGSHRVMCGDCRSTTDVDMLLAGHLINVGFTSPPYAEQRTYDSDSGFRPIAPDEYVEWFTDVASNVASHLADDGSWFVNIKAASRGLDTELYVLDLVLAHARDWGWHFATEFCWERSGMPQKAHRRFKNQFEPIYQFARGEWKFRPDAVRHKSDAVPDYSRNNHWAHGLESSQGATGRGWENIAEGLAYPGNRLPTFSKNHEATGHGAAFPVGLPAWFIRAYSDAGDTVYDPFCGSGSTILAAHAEGRVGFGMELSPRYVDVICARFQKNTGIKPVAEATGREHDFLENTPNQETPQ